MLIDLPDLVIRILIRKLNVSDFVKLRLVCRKLKFFCDEVQLTELVIQDEIKLAKNYWFLSEKLIDYLYNSIHLNEFKYLRFILKFRFKQLRRFRIDCSINDLNFDLVKFINSLHLLEHLELLNNFRLYFSSVINLPNLIIFKSSFLSLQLFLNTPRLEILNLEELFEFKFYYPQTIKYLKINEYNQKIEEFKFLEHLEFRHGVAFISKNLFSVFSNLKVLKINVNYRLDYFDSDTNNGIHNALILFMKQLLILKRFDIKIYFEGVLILNRSVIEQYDINYGSFEFQIRNYDLLSNNLNSKTISYNELLRLTGPKLRDDFFQKYKYIRKVNAYGDIVNQNHFNQFLKGFKLLDCLILCSKSLDQQFYDNIPLNFDRLIKLGIFEEPEHTIDLNFILKFKFLKKFDTNQELINSRNFIIEFIKGTHVSKFTFVFKKFRITIEAFLNYYGNKIYDIFYYKDGMKNMIQRRIDLKMLLLTLDHLSEKCRVTRSSSNLVLSLKSKNLI